MPVFSQLQLISGVACIAVAGLWVYNYGNNRFDDGYNKAIYEQQQKANEEFTKLSQQYKVLMSQKISAERDAERRINDLLKVTPEKEIITKKVVQYVENTHCKRLGDDFVGLFNDIHRTDATDRND